MKHFGDITKIHGWEVPIVDVVTGGSPCQDLSVAGRREGLKGERSGLFMEQIRIIKEMREHDRETNKHRGIYVRPRFMVWENVAGAFSSNGGEDFRAVLEETARIADADAIIPRLAEKQKWSKSGAILGDGWSIAWRLHDAQFWGVPQRRQRISLVADFGGSSAPEILFERKGMSGNSEQSRETREGASEDASGSLDSASRKIIGSIGHDIRASRFTDDEIVDPLTTTDYKDPIKVAFSIGNGQVNDAMSPSEEVSKTLNCMDNVGKIMTTFTADRTPKTDEKGIAFSLLSRDYKCPQGIAYERNPKLSVIRRLTPLECERLQGFPDGWTDIGDWTDTKGKKHKGESDSPRNKALGNSIALPFWEWMAERMVAQLRKDGSENPTMASLFDGIGGFPLVYQRNGCEPVWASEIEEFPMAVTKIRFPEGE